MHSPIPHIPKIKALNLPDLKPIETDSVPKKQGQSLKEWAMAGGGVPEQYKGREHVWHKKVASFADGGEVHMAKGGDPRGEMRATPEKSPQAAAAARALKMAHEFASRPFGYNNPPGEMLSEFLGVPDVANTLERIGYGEPLTTGKGMTTKPREEALNAAMAVAPLAQMTKGMPVGAIIKPKGGNWYKTPPNGASVEGSIERLRPYQSQKHILPHAQEGYDQAVRQSASDPSGRALQYQKQQLDESTKRHALNQWVENNLQNYVKKQMGTMDDPIRALHEQGITHMPKDVREGLGEVERDTMERRVAAGFPKEGVAKSDLAKEWENLADQNIWSSKAGDVQHAQTVMPELQKADRALKNHEDMLTMRFRQKLAENPDLSSAERRMLEEKMPMSQKAAMVGDEKHDELLQNRARLASVANGGDWHIGQNNPWVANLPPETDLHQGIASGMGFDHVIDILKQEVEAGRIRPDLHPGFPTLITGKDLGMNMMPTPTEVYLPDWHRKFKADNPDRKAPGYYDLALGVKGQGLPSQEINDEFIRHLLREGFKAGGAVGGLSAATKSCSCHD